jgi:hypothetical protein
MVPKKKRKMLGNVGKMLNNAKKILGMDIKGKSKPNKL